MELPLSSPCGPIDSITFLSWIRDDTLGIMPTRKVHPRLRGPEFLLGLNYILPVRLTFRFQTFLEIDLIPHGSESPS